MFLKLKFNVNFGANGSLLKILQLCGGLSFGSD